MRLPVDLIVVQGEAVLEIRSMSLPVPVIYAYSADPVIAGLAESLARPNPNMTGLTYMAVELNGKRLELLRETGAVDPPGRAARQSGVSGRGGERDNSVRDRPAASASTFATSGARTADELKAAFAKMAADKAQAISLLADSFTVQNRGSIMAFATEQRIPVVSSWPVFAEAGALCTHGPRLARLVPSPRLLRRSRPARHQARRPADRAADDDRDDRQPQDRRRPRPEGAAGGAGARRPRDPLIGVHRREC